MDGLEHRRYFHHVPQILDHLALHASEALTDIIGRLKLGHAFSHIHI